MNETGPLRSTTPAIDIYIRLAQYPILCDKIRLRMCEELFRRGVVNQIDFEREVQEMAIDSRIREGFGDSSDLEEESTWQKRKAHIRDIHTDAYFASNLGGALLDQLINEVLQNQPAPTSPARLTFNPEISPWTLLFRQGAIYEELPLPEREPIKHHLEEIKVVLIRRIISDQLLFIGLARQTLTVADLHRAYKHLIGTGKIGGKAAGMLLAWKILQQTDPEFGPDISQSVVMPDSFYIGSEVIYEFILMNELEDFVNQKYRPEAEMRAVYPEIVTCVLQGQFSENIIEQLRDYLARVGDSPLIVRSSSLLEDNFNYPFSGRYDSYICPNQGDEESNLEALLIAIKRVFASIFNPEAMRDRQNHGLLDYDERMAVLLQRVEGQRYGRYYFSMISGIAYSQNFDCWEPQIRRQDGILRLVLGLGTRVTNISGHSEPRWIPLSHPQLRQEKTAVAIRHNAQQSIEVVDLIDNQIKTVPLESILQQDFPNLAYIASLDKGDHLETITTPETITKSDKFVLTFDYLTQDRKFLKLIRTALMRLENSYQSPIELEFLIEILPNLPTPNYRLHILQCRPLRDPESNAAD